MLHTQEILLASEARTATTNTAEQTNRSHRGVLLFLDVTAASGTSPTLDVKVQGRDPASGKWFDIPNAAFAQKTAVSSDTLLLYPGAAETANRAVSTVLPSAWRAVCTIGGTNPSLTFSLGAVLVA